MMMFKDGHSHVMKDWSPSNSHPTSLCKVFKEYIIIIGFEELQLSAHSG